MSALLLAASLALASPPLHVMDQVDVIPVASESDLETKLTAFEDQHKIEVVVATFASTGGRPVDLAARQVAKEWAVGSRTANRAVLITFWRDDRETRIDVTDSLPQFSSGRAADVVDDVMVPHFKRGDFALGLEAGAMAVTDTLAANPWAPSTRRRGGSNFGRGIARTLGGLGTAGIVVLFVVLRMLLGAAGFGGGYGYRRGWGYRRSSWGGSSWGGRSSWGGSSRGSWGGGGGGFSGRGASGKW